MQSQFASVTACVLFGCCAVVGSARTPFDTSMRPLVRVVDLDIGESVKVKLCDDSVATVKLISLNEQRDHVCDAVRRATVTLSVNGHEVKLIAASYNLPVEVAGVQVDGAITRGYLSNSKSDSWGLDKAVRVRLWPAGSPWIRPETFQYPVDERWFATLTQMANVPVYVDGGELPGPRSIYYHSGLDFGGAEGMVNVRAATDGLVVSTAGKVLDAYAADSPVSPRYDVVYVLDRRGWFYRYSHLMQIAASVELGKVIKMGEPIGILGKEGASGGWSHTHFEIKCRQPSGKWGTQQAYPFVWQAYLRQYQPSVIAVARPHCLAVVGETVTLDASKSSAASGKIADIRWMLADGDLLGSTARRTYRTPGMYSEKVRVTDDQGNVDFDFAVVQVIDPQHPDRLPPSIHAAYAPTFGIKPALPVTFKVRSFRTTSPATETWDFGDHSPAVVVHSDGNADAHAKNGYAVTTHAFEKSGDYIVTASTTNQFGLTATQRLVVHVD